MYRGHGRSQAARLWNALSVVIRTAKYLPIFKNLLVNHCPCRKAVELALVICPGLYIYIFFINETLLLLVNVLEK